MEKVISIPAKVDDLVGLYHDLVKSDFAIQNVGADQERTYVYLESHEEKDPATIVLGWVGKEPPATHKEAAARSMKMKAEEDEFRAKKTEASRASAAASLGALDGVPVDPMPPDRPSILRRIFK
ncbi:MAG TPA: hypothetical protein VEN81_15725, partial [Planctomycetota bacterium]|nr:hypothetical protein [Planctomycetota bacterium]